MTNYMGGISGLELVWVSATQVGVRAGAINPQTWPDPVLSVGHYQVSGTTLTPARTASAWHYVYGYPAPSGMSFEVSTVAPAAPYEGTARSKSTDTTRRLIGSFKTDASSNIYNFRTYPGGEMRFQEFPGVAPFRVLNLGTASVLTTVNLSDVVPLSSTRALCRVIALGGPAFLSHPGISAEITVVSTDREVITPVELNNVQRL